MLDEVFAVLEPAALAATAKALAGVEGAHAKRLGAFDLAVERARFEADRARRQFDACEPENRLVGRTLEVVWEEALATVRRAEADLAAQKARRPTRLSAEELDWIARAGADCEPSSMRPPPPTASASSCLRAVVAEVITVRKDDRQADVDVVWQGGANTAFTMELTRAGGHFRTTDEDTVVLLRRLAAHYDDTTIAVILSRQGRRTATGLGFTKTRVASLRVTKGITAYHAPPPTPPTDNAVIVGLVRAEQLLGVSKVTIYRWLRDGFITGEQLTPGGPWHIRIDDALRSKVLPEVPDGWVGLDTAAKSLGVARRPCSTASGGAISGRCTSTGGDRWASPSTSVPLTRFLFAGPERNGGGRAGGTDGKPTSVLLSYAAGPGGTGRGQWNRDHRHPPT